MTRFTIEDMEKFAAEAWGELGVNVVKRWAEFNRRYFTGELSRCRWSSSKMLRKRRR